MPATVLPRLIEEKFDDLSQQVRRLWLYRGIGRVVVVAILAGLAGMIVDRAAGNLATTRWIVTLTWLAVVAAALWKFVLQPQRRRLDATTLAAAIETQFPSLSERLMTLVELHEKTEPGHGSKPLIDILVRDTAQRTKRLNFSRAAPSGPALRIALLAGLLLGIGLASTLFVSGGASRVKRLVLPWSTPAVEEPFAIRVSSGSVVVKRGESVTLTAYLERLQPEAALPNAAVLIARDKAGAEKKLPMTGDSQAAFLLTRPNVTADFDYRVEAGSAASDWFSVAVADPVDLAEGTAIVMTPPEYASPPLIESKRPGLAAIEGLQHSQIGIHLKFNRPATGVTLDWQPEGEGGLERLRITLSDDGRSAMAAMPLTASGTLRLNLTGDHGLVTALTIPAKATIDAPPRFEKAIGISDRPKDVRPDETVIIETTVLDDFRIDSLVLEYAVNGGKPIEVPLAVREPRTVKAESKHVFALTGKVKSGDTLTYRLRATDNRRVPGANLAPQVTCFPEKSWATLAISSSAEPLEKQEILAQRDAIREKLKAAAAAANDARKQAEQLKRTSEDQPMLTPEQVARLQKAREAAEAAAKSLESAAGEAAVTPELHGLAESMCAAAQDGPRAADDKLRRSETEAVPKARTGQMGEAEAKLAGARDRIDELLKLNEEIARNRLDKRRLEKLSDEVNRLAAEAEQATDPAKRDELLAKLQRARDELREIVNGNELLRRGAENAVNNKARELADEAGRLKQAQSGLDAAVAESEVAARKSALADSAAKQESLNREAEAIRNRTNGPARLNGDEPLAKPPFDEANEKLKSGDAVGAMTEQEKAARDLDRLADNLAKAAGARKDPKEAARQLAKAQDDLRRRTREAGWPLKPADKSRLAAEQEAILKAAEKLTAPRDDVASQSARSAALARLKDAGDALENNAVTAEADMKAAADALRQFADKLPDREARLKLSSQELAKLQRAQEALRGEAEEKLKAFEKKKLDESTQREIAEKLKSTMQKQAELARKLEELDVPGLEARRERVVQSARRAEEDFRDGRPLDIPASQEDLRRRMAQLRASLEGGTPGDSIADELARQQNRLAERLADGQPDAAMLADLQKLQREIADRAGRFNDPDAAERLTRARQSTEAAAGQKADNLDELRKKTRQAARDLDDLADYLAGVETDRERIDRLAKQRRQRADESKANAAKATPSEQAAALQGELERELADLKQTRSGSAQEAKKSALDQLERLRRTPNAERAPTLQQAAAEALEELAKKMKREDLQPPRGPRQAQENPGDGAGGLLPSQADADAARKLAAEQRALRDAASKAAGQAKPDAAATAAQTREQTRLAEQAGQLSRKLDEASHATTNDAAAANNLTQAAEAAKKAKEQMEKASREQSAGRNGGAGEARQEAGKALDEAQSRAAAAAGSAKSTANAKAQAASQAAEEAGSLLREAGPAAAKNAAGQPLKKAAGKIGDAADRLGEAGQPPPPKPGANPNNNGGGSRPLTADQLPADLKQYAGKPWGDLPGDVQARIIQDLKAKYGEDYARAIKLYFETLAEKK